MDQAKRFVVDVMATFEVEADTPDSALRAVTPIVPAAPNIKYAVREVDLRPALTTDTDREPYAHLTKSVYTVDEVAEILGLSRSIVYEKVPCIRIGRRRLYPRATITNVLKDGLKADEPAPIRPVQRRWRETPSRPAKVVRPKRASEATSPGAKPNLSVKATAKMLRLSYAKTKELLDSRKIYSVKSFGRRIILPEAVDHFLRGGTPPEYVETLIEYARTNGAFKDDPEGLEEAAAALRREWPK